MIVDFLGMLQYEDLEQAIGWGMLLFILGIIMIPFVLIPAMLWSLRSWLKRLTESVEAVEALLRAEAGKGPRPGGMVDPRPNP